jgi:hypothetical protein
MTSKSEEGRARCRPALCADLHSPTAAIIDTQAVKATEKGAAAGIPLAMTPDTDYIIKLAYLYMLGTIVAIIIILAVGIVLFIFNTRPAKHFAQVLYSLTSWILPPMLRREHYYVIGYRVSGVLLCRFSILFCGCDYFYGFGH